MSPARLMKIRKLTKEDLKNIEELKSGSHQRNKRHGPQILSIQLTEGQSAQYFDK